jgi:hypothetical protein
LIFIKVNCFFRHILTMHFHHKLLWQQ